MTPSPEAVIARVTALCEIPSVSRQEGPIAARAAQILREDGLDVEEQEVEPRRRNVIARLKTDRAGPRPSPPW